MGFKSRLLLLALVVLLSTPAFSWQPYWASLPCASYEDYFHWTSLFRSGHQYKGIDVNDTHGFVAARIDGIHVFDLSTPDAPSQVASFPCGEDAVDIRIHDTVGVVRVHREDEEQEGYYYTDIYLIDISDPIHLSIILVFESLGYRTSAEADGHVFFGTTDGLLTVDVRDPDFPQILDTDPVQEESKNIAMAGNHLWVPTPTRLCAIDISTPGSPVLVSELPLQESIRNLTIIGDRLLMTTAENLIEVDIHDPGFPLVTAELGICQEVGWVEGNILLADEELAFITCTYFGTDGEEYSDLQVFDISTPAFPQLTGVATLPRCRLDFFRPPFLFGNAFPGMFAVDVSDPTSPTTVMWTDTFLFSSNRAATSSHLYTTTDVGLCTFAFSNAPAVPPLARIETPGLARGLAMTETHAFVADSRDGIQIVELGYSGDWSIVANIPVSGSTKSLFVEDNYLFAGDRENGVLVAAVGNPSSPDIVHKVILENGASILETAGDLLGVVSNRELILFDKRYPRALPRLGAWEAPSSIRGLWLDDDLAFVTSGYDLLIVDVSNPASMTKVSKLSLPHTGEGLDLVGNYVYVGMFRKGLVIVDVSDPAQPMIVGRQDTPDAAYNVTVHGNLAYVSGGQAGVQIIDVEDPTSPGLVGRAGFMVPHRSSFHLLFFNRDAVVQGNLLYLVEEYGLQVVPLLCRGDEAPVEVVVDLKPGGDMDRINCSSGGVLPVAILSTPEFDALEIDHETVVFGPGGAHEAHSNRHGVKRHEKDVDHDGQVDLLFHFRIREADLDCTAEEVELRGQTFDGQQIRGAAPFRPAPPHPGQNVGKLGSRAHPNPFNPQTTILFELPGQTEVNLRVYDLSGRLVRNLIGGESLGPGRHEVVWNGRDNAGLKVASGIYFFRMVAGDLSETRRMMLVK